MNRTIDINPMPMAQVVDYPTSSSQHSRKVSASDARSTKSQSTKSQSTKSQSTKSQSAKPQSTESLSAKPDILQDFLRFPFRLNFLLSALCAILVASIWPMVAIGIYPFQVDPITLHAYGFLNSVGGAGFAGFILTAIPEWTHDNRSLIPYSSALLICWLLGAVASLFAPAIASLAFFIFWLALGAIATHFALRARNSKIISIIILLCSVAILNLCYLYQPSLFWLEQIAHIFMAGVALITFRIGNSIGNKALEGSAFAECRFVPNPFYRNLSVWFIYLYVASQIFMDDAMSSAWMSVAVGLSMLGRLRDWHYPIMFKKYYIRWFYLTLATIGIGYVWLGASSLLGLHTATAAFHLILIGGFLLMMMQVFSIAGVSHSSLDLFFPLVSRLGLACIIAAALSRSFGTLSQSYYVLFVFYLPATLIALAFAMYIPVFYRIFRNNPGAQVTPRVKN